MVKDGTAAGLESGWRAVGAVLVDEETCLLGHLMSSELLKALLLGKQLKRGSVIREQLFHRAEGAVSFQVVRCVADDADGDLDGTRVVGKDTWVVLLPRSEYYGARTPSRTVPAVVSADVHKLQRVLEYSDDDQHHHGAHWPGFVVVVHNPSNTDDVLRTFVRVAEDAGRRTILVPELEFETRRLMLSTENDHDGYLTALKFYLEMADALWPSVLMIYGVSETGLELDEDAFLASLEIVASSLTRRRCVLCVALERPFPSHPPSERTHRLLDIADMDVVVGAELGLAVTEDLPSTFSKLNLAHETDFDRLRGLDTIKHQILERIIHPLTYPHHYAPFSSLLGHRLASNVLLYGPPGTGKTLLARTISSTLGVEFRSVDAASLASAHVGGAEAKLSAVFSAPPKTPPADAAARARGQVLVFIDEVDALFAGARGGGEGAGSGAEPASGAAAATSRLISALFFELDGLVEREGHVAAVMAATNNPWGLDRALLRPGRFDLCLYVGPAESAEARLDVIEGVLGRFPVDGDVDDAMKRVAAETAGFTGADLSGICRRAILMALHRHFPSESPTAGVDDASGGDVKWSVSKEDLLVAWSESKGSVSEEDLAAYAEWQAPC